MNTIHSFVLAVMLMLLAPCSQATLIQSLKYGEVNFIVSPSLAEARTDATPDNTTVRATLVDNPTRLRWEFRLWKYQTGSPDLTGDLDVTAGTDVTANFFIYQNNTPQTPRSFYVYGADVRDVNYNLGAGTFSLKFRPVAPAITTTINAIPGGYTAIGGIDFNYYGAGSSINYTPPIVAGNVFWNDLSRAMHPTSKQLLGVAVRVDGVEGQPVEMDFIIGSHYANRWRYNLNETRGYLDGLIPDSGFTATLSDPGISISTDIGGDSFKKLGMFNYNFSVRDLQAGVFLRFTNIVQEVNGVRLYWNPQTTNRYTVQYFSTLGGPTNILGTNLPGPSILDTQAVSDPMRIYRLRGQ